MDNDYSENTKSTSTMSIAVIAIVAALALLGVVVVMVAVNIPLQEAKAVGCTPGSLAFNASQGRCFSP